MDTKTIITTTVLQPGGECKALLKTTLYIFSPVLELYQSLLPIPRSTIEMCLIHRNTVLVYPGITIDE